MIDPTDEEEDERVHVLFSALAGVCCLETPNIAITSLVMLLVSALKKGDVSKQLCIKIIEEAWDTEEETSDPEKYIIKDFKLPKGKP